MRLSELKTGEVGVIVRVMGHGGFRKRIVEMGFIKGKTVEVLLNAPLHDPVKYKVMDYEVSLRRAEAELVEVETTQMGSLYKLYYTVEMKDGSKLREFMDELRCRNGNLEVMIYSLAEAGSEL